MTTNGTDRDRLNGLVRDAIKKLGTSDVEKIRAEVVLTQKEKVGRKELKEAIAAAGPLLGDRVSPLKMTDLERFKLMTWLNDQRDFIRNTSLNVDQVIEEFQKKHPDIALNENNVRSDAKMLGVEIPRRRTGSTRNGGLVTGPIGKRLGEQDARIEAMEKRLDGLLAKLAPLLDG